MNSMSYSKKYRLLSEANILIWIQDHVRNNILTPIFLNITRLGNRGLIWIVMASLLFIGNQTRTAGILSGLSLIGSMIINNFFIKRIVARTRPYEAIPNLKLLIEKEKDLSFPSGHTGCAFAMATVLLFCFPQSGSIFVLLFAFLMGLSRLYVGAHYPSDVLAGGAIGSLIGSVVFMFLELPISMLVQSQYV